MNDDVKSISNDPLHGITLEKILTELVEYYGWTRLGRIIDIKCFNNDPSIKSSLQFLRRTAWARKKVEDLYLKYKKKTSIHTDLDSGNAGSK
jgi:uncharacterized protein (DUF2132 family)